MSLLEHINTPKDIKQWPIEQLELLAEEIRKKIINTVASTGGHLASNLGAVELILALHYVFDSPDDLFFFDTSHQSYTHKLLTGRNKKFQSLRQNHGICGFSHPKESVHDHVFAGHAGTAFSTSLGAAIARDSLDEKNHILSILGDGSLTCGLTLEALNQIPKNLKNFLLILNDNKMAISKNVGNITNVLSRLINNPATNKLYMEIIGILEKVPAVGDFLAKSGKKVTDFLKHLVSPASFFEPFGLSYIGPIDGHDIKKLIDTLIKLKNHPKPILLHILTTKGKGMTKAAENPTPYHGVKPFHIDSGIAIEKESITFPKIFGQTIVELGRSHLNLAVITPAMVEGSHISLFQENFPQRCFDVGIAEGHSITFASGLALKRKMKVIVSIYASFLQRALDNVFHDICLQNIPITIAIDRSGINAPDGATHHGIYDLAFLAAMPNLILAQPRNGHVLKELLYASMKWTSPSAIRYPNQPTEQSSLPIASRSVGLGEVLIQGTKVLLIGIGSSLDIAFEVRQLLKPHGFDATIFDPIFIKPLDENTLKALCASHDAVITIEEHVMQFGFASILDSFLIRNNFFSPKILHFGIEDIIVEHGSLKDIRKELGLDPEHITQAILNLFKDEKNDFRPFSQQGKKTFL
ncbi:MAG: 1-deoxy-D-xylulose-5-phosphate synthase [Parachlamydiales bacterium]|nr:1-deoxy-D-xylulose-5-phosphate synthase [Parachlamydiales bacterium]